MSFRLVRVSLGLSRKQFIPEHFRSFESTYDGCLLNHRFFNPQLEDVRLLKRNVHDDWRGELCLQELTVKLSLT